MSPQKPEGAWGNLIFNIVIPVSILTFLSGKDRLGPLWGLLIALAFPLTYGAIDLWKEKKWNFMSILGLVSVLLTGGLVLLKLDGIWFSIKEAAVPLVIGIFVFATSKTKYSIVKKIFMNPHILRVEEIEAVLDSQPEKQKLFDRLITQTTLIISFSFLLSAVLNFVLAEIILQSPSGTEQFNKELGRMTALSFPVIMVPCTIILVFSLWFMVRGLKQITGLESILRDQ